MTLRRLALLAIAITLPLAGCGKMGELERPGPMFGDRSATNAPPRGPAPPVSTVDRRDLDADADIPDLPAPGQANTTALQ
jgi:hypothetical protein